LDILIKEMDSKQDLPNKQFYQSTYAGLILEISVVVGQEVKKRMTT
jgi:hypothetical protein